MLVHTLELAPPHRRCCTCHTALSHDNSNAEERETWCLEAVITNATMQEVREIKICRTFLLILDLF